MSKTIGFIGLGTMGSPMAVNLAKAGHTVHGWNRSDGRSGPLLAAGGRAAASIREAVREADVVITMLPDSPQVEEVSYGPDGILAHARRGALVIDMSTIAPRTSTELARKAAEQGIRVLDAPVAGGEAGAIDGVLSIMVGGEAADFEEAKPVFEALGRTIVHCGPHGIGQTVKAANQLILAVNIQACAEAVVFLEKSGVKLEAALDVLGGGLAGSHVLTRKKNNFLRRDYTPSFTMGLHSKDMGIVSDTARAIGAVLPLASIAAQLIGSAVARGDADLDHSALLRGVELLSGYDAQ
ncbi:2-hydroxy-3-oxopropionate reductase [Streptomyces sioyaensis]|uniref:2-hydroxy-3-oxopropionate reductase n=1 Tax=Streptomyces sioyaensis TaxID=67364 RepID=A0A4Q1R1E7_9ACTN|nr:2-hydroxy-3-oxopropionate reductase [Streptomyces sioyaensis]MBM4794429.1 2-hydroxy-3-oxopropionate reductase [Streptomyces sioyaensis]RXS66491.1 2-hydroxy-3-oxopropionate reductase [Streptomyces sioyaensis]